MSGTAVQTADEILQALREQLPRLAAQFGVKRIGLFGSFARSAGSDVDLIIEFEQEKGT